MTDRCEAASRFVHLVAEHWTLIVLAELTTGAVVATTTSSTLKGISPKVLTVTLRRAGLLKVSFPLCREELRLVRRDGTMPSPYPAEFRADVVRIARNREATLAQIAKDFGTQKPHFTPG